MDDIDDMDDYSDHEYKEEPSKRDMDDIDDMNDYLNNEYEEYYPQGGSTSVPLLKAIKSGNLNTARDLIQKGEKISVRDVKQICTLPHFVEIMRLLIANGLDINIVMQEVNCIRPTVMKEKKKYEIMLDLLAGNSDTVEDRIHTLLLASVDYHDVNSAMKLVERGLNPNAVLVRTLVRNQDMTEQFNQILKLGASVNKCFDGQYPLYYLMEWYRDFDTALTVKRLKLIIENGFDVKQSLEKGSFVYYPISYAIEQKLPLEFIKVLLDNGADPNSEAMAYGGIITPINKVKEHPQPVQVIELLMERGADLFKKSEDGRLTPFQNLCWTGDELFDMVNKLLEYNPDVSVPVLNPEPISHIAFVTQVPNNGRIMKRLIEYGYDVSYKPKNDSPLPLHFAVKCIKDDWHDPKGEVFLESISVLIAHGAELEASPLIDVDLFNALQNILHSQDTPDDKARKFIDAVLDENMKKKRSEDLQRRNSKSLGIQLYEWCKEGNMIKVKEVLNAGASFTARINPDSDSRHAETTTPFGGAILSHSVPLMQYIIADLKISPETISVSADSGTNHFECRRSYNAMCVLLEQYSRTSKEFKQFIEHVVNMLANKDLINLPIASVSIWRDWKPEPLTKLRDNQSNMTYLHYFASYENKEVCELLLNYGADLNAITKSGNTPVDLWPALAQISRCSAKNRAIEIGTNASKCLSFTDQQITL
jgi:ankyrin repeat protein